MRRLAALAIAVAGMLVPAVVLAHPHIWVQQLVRVVAKDGKYTHVEIEWRFDPLGKYGFMSWLNTGGKDFRPGTLPQFSARIHDPASFVPPDWDRTAGDGDMPMPANKRAGDPSAHGKAPRNLVYVMRLALPAPSRFVSIATYDPDDFIRIEVDKASLPAGCRLGKHPRYKAELVRGHPVFADFVTCELS